jgi:CRISPR-associated endonuclease/helicase Cas3
MDQDHDFAAFFRRATGNAPYGYQVALAQSERPPDVVSVPTGSGKTHAVLAAWLHQRLRGEAPRRLVYALPMRTLVEQTAGVAVALRHRLGLTPDELPIHVLMGGEESPEGDWRLRPEASQILVGTIDMLLSRALNRGYAESRFAWPVSFGLLNADCRWVFDEVQLMGPARTTSAQLDGLRAALGAALPCETTWVSATVDREALRTVDRPDLGPVVTLAEKDRRGPLARRLEASKVLERVDVTDHTSTQLAHSIAELALARHVTGTRTLVVLNTVDGAQATFKRLRKATREGGGPSTVLLHSRFRPLDRAQRMAEALEAPRSEGAIVVSTQVIEAGVDMSARTLVTEPAPFSSIVQRLGRCNRAGEHSEGAVIWLDRGPVNDDASGRKAAAPYLPGDVERARLKLLELEGASLSPSALEHIDVAVDRDDPVTLRRRDLLDLFDTSPDLSGTDIDIAPFIREDDDRSVTVFFRDLGDEPGARIEDEPIPARNELVQVPLGDVRDRDCWLLDYVDGVWWRTPARSVPPGATVMLSAADGGYDPDSGWSRAAKARVTPLSPGGDESAQGLGSDPMSAGTEPQELLPHLTEAAAQMQMLADTIGTGAWREPLVTAAALHDIGKAHPVFQHTLRRAIDAGTHPDRDQRLWAKSGGRGGRHGRRHFRHELASALALKALDGEIAIPRPALTGYLIGAHHGKVRMSIRPAPEEMPPQDAPDGARFALGVADGDSLPAVETPLGTLRAVTLDLAPMELGADDSWTDAAVALRDDPELGPFRLGFLEALLRVADWRASA